MVEPKQGRIVMRRLLGIQMALLVVIGLHSSAWANNELSEGGRLFYPLWDVSTPNRLTFIIVTRQAMREGARFELSDDGWQVSGTPGKCLPRGPFGSTTNVNRTDLGGTVTNPVFVDDVHLEYYGQSCIRADEVIHMSCGDIDLFVLASPDNEEIQPRRAFSLVAAEGRGALDVHFITNGSAAARERKLENSLMGEAIIVDTAEGWSASYAAAAAKAVPCPSCDLLDDGTEVGYENYPMEVYLPVAFADGFPIQGSALRNLLALWEPGLLPGKSLVGTFTHIDWKWWDGRERFRVGSVGGHSIIRPLGGDPIDGLFPLDALRFKVANFVCGHTNVSGQAENDGFPRTGTDAADCGVPDVGDPTHTSDNFENVPDLNLAGHTIQPSTPIGWWRFHLRRDNEPPPPLPSDGENVYSGRGLVGVVLSASPGRTVAVPPKGEPRVIRHFAGMARATRLWHEDPCEVAQSGTTVGPPHERDRLLMGNDNVALFNVKAFAVQKTLCGL
jgi:hypothetical protein